jgi:hypothetical protein
LLRGFLHIRAYKVKDAGLRRFARRSDVLISSGGINVTRKYQAGIVFTIALLGLPGAAALHSGRNLLRLVPSVQAGGGARPDFSIATCTSEMLEGSYAITTTGSIVSLGPVGLVAEVGVIKFDGDVGVEQTTTVSLNGAIIQNRTSQGTYVVYPDCTGTITLTLPPPAGASNLRFVILDHGDELRVINTGTGRVLVSDVKRQHIRRW